LNSLGIKEKYLRSIHYEDKFYTEKEAKRRAYRVVNKYDLWRYLESLNWFDGQIEIASLLNVDVQKLYEKEYDMESDVKKALKHKAKRLKTVPNHQQGDRKTHYYFKYKPIGTNKWLKMKPDKVGGAYYDNQLDKNNRDFSGEVVDWYEIIIDKGNPNRGQA